MKRFAVQVALVLATLSGAVLLWQFRDAILLFTLALATVATLRPGVDFLVARGVRRSLSLALTCLAVAVGSLAVAVALGAPLLGEAQRGADELMRAYDSASGSQASLLRQLFVERLPASADLYRALGSQTPGSGAHAVLGLTTGTLGLVGRAVVVLAMSLYWIAGRDAFEHWGLSLLPSEWRVRTRETWRAAKAAVGAHLRAQLVKSLSATLLLDLGFHLLHLRYPTLPAVAGGLGLLVPVVGVPFAVLSAAAAGLADGSVQAVAAGALAAAVFTLIAALGARAFPLRKHSPILEIVTLIALADAAGLPGLLAAAPVAAALRVVGERLLFAPPPMVSADLDDVALRLRKLRETMVEAKGPLSPALLSVVDRLDGLVRSSKLLDAPP